MVLIFVLYNIKHYFKLSHVIIFLMEISLQYKIWATIRKINGRVYLNAEKNEKTKNL